MAQFARPSGDQSIGSWTGDPTNTVGNRYQNIDEISASDADFVRSENNPSNSAAEFNLSSVTDPESSSSHIVNFREQMVHVGGGSPSSLDITCGLYEGTTLIASAVYSHGTGDAGIFYDRTFTLSAAEADSISDYTNLRLRFTANKTAGNRTNYAVVSWAEFSVPNAGGGRRIFIIS